MGIAKGRGAKPKKSRTCIQVTIRDNPFDQHVVSIVEAYSSELDLSLSDTVKNLVVFADDAKKAGAIIEDGVLKKLEKF